MTRMAYISGRYRHWNLDGSENVPAMLDELGDERQWAVLAVQCGFAVYCPLANSVPIERDVELPGSEWIELDLAVIRRMVPGYDVILVRPGWDSAPESQGARIEYNAAHDRGLLVAHGCQGPQAVRQYLNAVRNGQLVPTPTGGDGAGP